MAYHRRENGPHKGACSFPHPLFTTLFTPSHLLSLKTKVSPILSCLFLLLLRGELTLTIPQAASSIPNKPIKNARYLHFRRPCPRSCHLSPICHCHRQFCSSYSVQSHYLHYQLLLGGCHGCWLLELVRILAVRRSSPIL